MCPSWNYQRHQGYRCADKEYRRQRWTRFNRRGVGRTDSRLSVVVATQLRAVMGKLGPHRKAPAVATVLQQAEKSLAEAVRERPVVEWGEHER